MNSEEARRKADDVTKKSEEFQRIAEKILQTYRIRLQLMMQRHSLLQSISMDFNNIIINNPNFYASLQ